MKRALTAVAVLATIVAAVLTGGAAPAPAQAPPTGTRASVELISQTAWLDDGGSFDLLLDIHGRSDRLELLVTVHDRLRSRSAFVQSLDGRAVGTRTRVRLGLGDVPVDGSGHRRISLALPSGDQSSATASLPELGEGVYPVSVAVRADGTTADRLMTHLIRVPDDGGATNPLTVAWIQRIGAPPALGPDDALSVEDRATLTRSLQTLTLAPTAPLTLKAVPETLLRLDGDALDPIRRSLAAGSQLLSTTYVDVDPDALVAAGLTGDLVSQREAGEEALFETLGTRGDARTWVADGALANRTLARLRELGVSRVVVPERSLEPLEEGVTGGTTLTRPFELSAGDDRGLRAAAIDTGLLEHFREGDGQVLAAHHLLADLAVLFFDFPGTTRGVVVQPPEGWEPSTAFLGTVLPAVADASILRLAPLEALFDGVEPLEDDGETVVRQPAATLRSTPLPRALLADSHAAIDDVAALVGPGAELVSDLRFRLLVGESSQLRPADRNLLLASILGERAEIEGRIRLPDRRTFRLTAREGTIPLTLVNDNAFPVTVDLLLSSDKLEFLGAPAGNRSRHVVQLELEPGTHTRTVPVRTRASGTFPVRATLLSTGGEVIRRGQFTITSSVFSGVGLVLSIGAGLFLLVWWARHWRTVRRDRRLVQMPQ